MDFKDVLKIYHKMKVKNPNNFSFIGKMFQDIKKLYKADAKKRGKDPNQSWNSWSGKKLQKLINYIVVDYIENLKNGFETVSDDKLRKEKLPPNLDAVRRNVEIFYGEYSLIPDADVIVYDKSSYKVKLILSCKASLRERVAQAAYWKLKLLANKTTEGIRVYLVSTDNDGDFIKRKTEIHRNRIIVEYDLDGAYIFREIEESNKIKTFNKIFNDIKRILSDGKE